MKPMTPSDRRLGLAAGCFCWLACSWAAGIDLRTDVQGQPVIRRVQYEWETDLPTAGGSTLMGNEQPSLLPMEEGFFEETPRQVGGDSGCGVSGCRHVGCTTCGPCRGRIWASAEFINWWRDGTYVPPLVTDGLLPSSNVLFGDDRIFDDSQGGLRFGVGTGLGPCCPWRVMARFYVLDDSEEDFRRDSDGSTMLARPFFNLSLDGANQLIGSDALLISDGVPGRVAVWGKSEVIGGDILAGLSLGQTCCTRTDLLLGYSTARIREELSIVSRTQQAILLSVFDRFEVTNEFHGATIGLLQQSQFNCLKLEVLGKLSFGNMRQRAFLNGGSTGNPNAGLLVQESNRGAYENNMFAVAPEIGVNLVYQPTPCLGVIFGYSFLYWSSVSQVGDLIDPLLRVNPNSPPPPGEFPQPDFEFRHQDFWVHGLNAGLRLSF